MEHQLEFTIIIPVWHSGNLLRNALSSLQQLVFQPDRFEVIVAGVHEDHFSQQIVQTFAADSSFEIRYVGCSEFQRAKLLNAACRAARGKILAFAADDCIFRAPWLKTLCALFSSDRGIGIVGGQDDLEPSESTFALALNYVLQSFVGTGGVRQGSGFPAGTYYPKLWNMALRREVAFQVAFHAEDGQAQVFNESLEVHEDVELGQRIAQAGQYIVYAPEARIGYKRDRTLWLFIKGNFQKARASRTLGVHRLSHLTLATFVFAVLILFFTSFLSPLLRKSFFSVLGAYGLLLLVVSIGGYVHTRSLKISIMIPGILVSLHVARGIGYFFPVHRQKRNLTERSKS